MESIRQTLSPVYNPSTGIMQFFLVIIVVLKWLIFLFERQNFKGKEKQRKRKIYCFTLHMSTIEPMWSEIRCQEMPPDLPFVWRMTRCWVILFCFPRPCTQSWTRIVAPGTWMDSDMGCWHCGQRISLLHHDTQCYYECHGCEAENTALTVVMMKSRKEQPYPQVQTLTSRTDVGQQNHHTSWKSGRRALQRDMIKLFLMWCRWNAFCQVVA